SSTVTPTSAFAPQTGSHAVTAGMPVPPAGKITQFPCIPFCVVNGDVQYQGATSTGKGSSGVLTDPKILKAYSYTGIPKTTTFDAEVTTSEGESSYTGTTTASGFLLWGGYAIAGGVVGVQYTYSVPTVPEPMTMMLVGGAIVGLGVLMRKRQR